MGSAKTQPARGMRDFLPDDVRKRNYVIGVIKDVYERYGFEPLETPAVENIETLMGKYGEEGNQLIFKILKRGVHESTGEADLALRYDLTVPLARVVAEYRDKLPKFFKRYQIQPVWRADRPARGRFREFYQCDVDVLGSRSMIVEAEICSAAGDVLRRLGFEDFTIRLNHRGVLTGILGVAGVALEQHDSALIALDKLDKIGREGVQQEFESRGIDAAVGERLLTFFTDLAAVEPAAIIDRVVEFVQDNEVGSKGVAELQLILDLVGSSYDVRIDPTLARGLSYYTGAIMEINVKDLAGSLGGGGRYDNLVGMFLNSEVPACGISLGLERILVVMNERGMFPEQITSRSADVMVGIKDDSDESAREALSLATELRQSGLKVDLYPDQKASFGSQKKYASTRNIPFAVVIDTDGCTITDLTTREVRTVQRDALATNLQDLLSASLR
jgi:histidyl-tRNA synthetase